MAVKIYTSEYSCTKDLNALRYKNIWNCPTGYTPYSDFEERYYYEYEYFEKKYITPENQEELEKDNKKYPDAIPFKDIFSKYYDNLLNIRDDDCIVENGVLKYWKGKDEEQIPNGVIVIDTGAIVDSKKLYLPESLRYIKKDAIVSPSFINILETVYTFDSDYDTELKIHISNLKFIKTIKFSEFTYDVAKSYKNGNLRSHLCSDYDVKSFTFWTPPQQEFYIDRVYMQRSIGEFYRQYLEEFNPAVIKLDNRFRLYHNMKDILDEFRDLKLILFNGTMVEWLNTVSLELRDTHSRLEGIKVICYKDNNMSEEELQKLNLKDNKIYMNKMSSVEDIANIIDNNQVVFIDNLEEFCNMSKTIIPSDFIGDFFDFDRHGVYYLPNLTGTPKNSDNNINSKEELTIKGTIFYNYTGKNTTLEVPNGIRILGKDALKNNTILTEIKLPSTLEKIQNGVLDGCNNLRKIIYAGSQEDFDKIKITSLYKNKFKEILAGVDLIFIDSKIEKSVEQDNNGALSDDNLTSHFN